ncbi:MAG: hypothetical protein QOJ89_5413, partial [bacterium]
HHHTIGDGVQRGRQSIPIDPQAFGIGLQLGEHRVDPFGRRRSRVVPVRLGERRDPTIEPAREQEHRDEQHDGADEEQNRQGGHDSTVAVIRTSR